MAYISIQDFKYGMDRRRERVAGTPGTLWTLQNAHITRGGDIERCKRFVPAFTLPAGSRGLVSLNKQLYVFGSADLAASMPLGIIYQRLTSPNAGVLTAVVDVCGFAGEVYVIADFDDGGRFHFYNGSRVTDWDVIAAAESNYVTLAQFLADKTSAESAVTAQATNGVISLEAVTPGIPFTISGSAVNGSGGTNDQTITVATPQANVAAVAEVRATATITINGGVDGFITGATLGAVALIGAPVQWKASNAATAIRLAQAINSVSSVSHYSAAAVGAVVTISAAVGTGATPNGTALTVVTSGDIAESSSATISGGVTAVVAVAQISTVKFGGTYEPADTFSIVLNGTTYKATGLASGTGRSCGVFFSRVWSPIGSLWRYSMLSRADIFDPANVAIGNDAGFLNVALNTSGNQQLIAAGFYQTFVAIYGEESVVVYSLDTDPANFAQFMVLDNISTTAAHSITRYGNNDSFHLDPTGVRSLRALNISNAPFVSDVGNAIDTFLLDYLDTLTEKQRRAACTAIEPRDGRFWMAVGETIFVLSFFPGAKISAWSFYSPGFEVEAFAKAGNRMYVRSGDVIYLYGGDDNATYPDENELPVLVELPFLGAGAPATKKGLTGFDAAFTNEWTVGVLVNANDESQISNVGVVRDKTYSTGDIAVPGQAPVMALKMTCTAAGRATVSMAQIHYEKQDEG